jgi:hypothetical protein
MLISLSVSSPCLSLSGAHNVDETLNISECGLGCGVYREGESSVEKAVKGKDGGGSEAEGLCSSERINVVNRGEKKMVQDLGG